MQLWYFSVIGVPIVSSFLVSLTVYLLFSKILTREIIEVGDAGKYKTSWSCKKKHSPGEHQKLKGIHQVAPSG
jgi:hypothetical protein